MEKSNHVYHPVPSVRKYDFTAPNLAPAPRNPRDIVSYCRGRGAGRSGLNLTAGPATTQSKIANFFPGLFADVVDHVHAAIVSVKMKTA
jgi:hypothetical protein